MVGAYYNGDNIIERCDDERKIMKIITVICDGRGILQWRIGDEQ